MVPDPYSGYPYQPEDVDRWRLEYDSEKMENILINRNREHLRQATGTPFTNEEMLRMFPFTAECEEAEKVLEGEGIEGPTREATEILKECRVQKKNLRRQPGHTK